MLFSSNSGLPLTLILAAATEFSEPRDRRRSLRSYARGDVAPVTKDPHNVAAPPYYHCTRTHLAYCIQSYRTPLTPPILLYVGQLVL